MYEELVKRLRDISNSDSNIKSNYIGLTMIQAADAIEQLAKDLEESKEYETFWHEEAEEALRKLQRILFIIDNKHCWILNPYMGDVITHWEPSTEPPKEET